jgi:threonine aldolase
VQQPHCAIHFRSDGIALSPAEYGRLLARLTGEERIAADEFSRGGAVEGLESRMAELLGKEIAVFMPSGTLANHLAVRLLAQRGNGCWFSAKAISIAIAATARRR